MAKRPPTRTVTSYHADLRTRKRFKVPDMSGVFEEALAHGTPINEFKGQLGRSLMVASRKHMSKGVVYKYKVFWYKVVKGTAVLTTVYPLDRKWHKYLSKGDASNDKRSITSKRDIAGVDGSEAVEVPAYIRTQGRQTSRSNILPGVLEEGATMETDPIAEAAKWHCEQEQTLEVNQEVV